MGFILHTKNNKKFLKTDRRMLFKIQKMLLNALNLIYCKFNITQWIIIEDISNIIKGELEVFCSV